MIGLLLLLLGQVSSLETEFTHNFHRYCCTNATCAMNFELTGCTSEYEYRRFEYMLEFLIHEQTLSEELFQTEETQVVLKGMMRGHRFCVSNEIMELDRGCVCRHDRRCNVKNPTDLRVTPWILILIALMATGLFLFYSITIVKKQEKIEKTLRSPSIGRYTTLDTLVTPYSDEE